VNLNYFYN